MCLLSKWLFSVDGGILSAILQVLTRYSANGRQLPVNDGSLFTGKSHAIRRASRSLSRQDRTVVRVDEKGGAGFERN
jgi:hypothetical protein